MKKQFTERKYKNEYQIAKMYLEEFIEKSINNDPDKTWLPHAHFPHLFIDKFIFILFLD